MTGGSGNDVITVLTNTLTSGAKIDLGAGNDQLLTSGGGKVDANVVIDGGAGTDTVANGLITVANGSVFKNFEKIALSTAATTTDAELLDRFHHQLPAGEHWWRQQRSSKRC